MNQIHETLAPYANKLIEEFAKEAATYKRIEALLAKASGPDFELLQDLDADNRDLQIAEIRPLAALTFNMEILSLLFKFWDYEDDTDWDDFDDDLRISLITFAQFIPQSFDAFYVVGETLKETITNADPSKKVFDPEAIESQEAQDLFSEIKRFGEGLLNAASDFNFAYFSIKLPA